MLATTRLNPHALDFATLSVVAICVVALLGLFLLFAWLQQRSVRALAWWASAYLIGASAIAMWSAPELPYHLGPELPQALAFIACGMFWNGVRLFQGRRLLPLGAFVGAAVWLLLCQLPGLSEGSTARTILGALVVAGYTFVIAFELGRERRKSRYSRTAAILVPSLHAAIFLMPLVMQSALADASASVWLTVFALETVIYAVGAAFIALAMVNDYNVRVYRSAAYTDPLTGLFNRRGFLENGTILSDHQCEAGKPVTLMMFDLDHFKSINDRFGHSVGDETLRLFSEVVRTKVRASDIIGRLGGEEFAVIVPEPMEIATKIAERLRTGFEAAGVTVGPHAVGATVSIGLATSHGPVADIDALMIRADAALYEAKHAGRNRVCVAEDEPTSEWAAARARFGPLTTSRSQPPRCEGAAHQVKYANAMSR